MKVEKLKTIETVGFMILIIPMLFAIGMGSVNIALIIFAIGVLFKAYTGYLYKKEGLLNKFWISIGQVAIAGLIFVALLIAFD